MRIVGLDGGSASIGWAVTEFDARARSGVIVACGVWMFHSPEGQSSTGAKILKNVERRTNRGQRTLLRRRKQRMAGIRNLFKDRGLLNSAARDALASHGLDPWKLRAEALDRALTPLELAVALGHIAKHRGFKSNKKGERSNAADETSKMLSAIDKTQERLAGYRTVGEMLVRDSAFSDRKRNREGDYTRSVLRDDQAAEVRQIFSEQRRLGNRLANVELEEAFTAIAFHQRELSSSLGLVGPCVFLEGEKRASAFAPSFEKFRFLSRLVTLRIVRGRDMSPLTVEERAQAVGLYGSAKTYSFKALRKAIGLERENRFAGVGIDKEGGGVGRSKDDVAGTVAMMKCLVPAVGAVEAKSLLAQGKPLDDAMEVIAFNEDLAKIREGLEQTGLSPLAVDALWAAAKSGDFNFVKGTGHVSAAAARRLNPHLAEGQRYDQACAAEGWDHAAQRARDLEDIKSPVARKAAREMMKQLAILERAHGPFDRVHVEMARDVGKSIEERNEIERGLNKRRKVRLDAEQELKELLKVAHVTGEDLLRYELWKEQCGRCLYSGNGISPQSILSGDNDLQVDHILPFSRFGDNSYVNKTLCYTTANQQKKDRTPFEWKNEDAPLDWERFSVEVETLKTLKGRKKRNYLLMNAEEVAERFRERNLNDTRYALKVVLGLLKRSYADIVEEEVDQEPPTMRRRVFARPGALTAALRRAWGLESLKKDPETGERKSDDRHHALDAIVVACCSESLLQRATRHAQGQERRGEKFELRHLPPPWGEPGAFRHDVEQAFEKLFVARPEIGRLRGKGHDAGIKQIREIDGEAKLFERKRVEDLKPKDLELIPVPEPYGKTADPGKLRDELVKNLRTWMAEKDALQAAIKASKGNAEEVSALKEKLTSLKPLSPKGDVIKKVRVQSKDKKAVEVRGGSAGQSEMLRVDVFSKPNKKGKDEFYLVPIYRSDVYSRQAAMGNTPPQRAVTANKPKDQWPVIDESFAFCFSLTRFSYVRVVRGEEVIEGYFRGLDSNTGAISVSPHNDSTNIRSGIGARTLVSFKKFRVDRLGRLREVKRETRTWRGKVCT